MDGVKVVIGGCLIALNGPALGLSHADCFHVTASECTGLAGSFPAAQTPNNTHYQMASVKMGQNSS